MDKDQEVDIQSVIDICLLAGRIMMQSGAETYRAEDTMTRMAAAYGISQTHSFVTPTGIIFSMDGVNPTRLVRINERSTDLEKVARVNSISRKISSGDISLSEASAALKELEKANLAFPVWIQIIAAAVASGCFLIMFKGIWGDFLPAFFVGGIGFSSLLLIHHFTKVKFFAEFSSSFVIGLLSVLLVSLGLGEQLDKIIIGSVMPLVPGLLITNAVRDLMAGHFVSGLSKGAEAFLTAFAIGAGVAVVFSF
ncbi:uncharacterized membrane protein YjjP (DUF1212 family) [Oikeobacillus pervagus]|uniref:Uncharacterized membrane protein YjjP (DUF1212 family) n=1 Tax=Oikeobacillus pervagus TaxID=1325931 RepID=A0AAJ1T0P1_9BACI|nr:threonine/serine exporter family protein [Oikeobacillus pervagus]MDQ0216089.1 uncharacterized membrane protein YjjP (DUF1212 family) [Oikeobacillus pervagus]